MGIPVALKQRTNSICKEGSGKYAEEKTKLVPGEGSGPNVCPFALSGWLRHESTPRELHAKPFNYLPAGMRGPVSAGCDTLPMFDVLKAHLA